MSERITLTNIQGDATEPISQNGVDFDLGRLIRRDDYHETIGFLNDARERFEEINWQGGVDPKLDFLGVRNLVTDIYRGNTSSHFVTTNERLALAQAIVFAYKPREVKQEFVDFIEKLREKAEREKTARLASSWLQTAQELENELKGPKNKRWLRKAALVVPPLALAAVYVGNKLTNSYSDSDVSDSQPRTSEVSQEPIDEQLESNSSLRLPSFLSNIGESIEETIKPIPKVEELDLKREGPFTLWGIDFSDSEAGFRIVWDSPEVLDRNNGQPLEIILYPVAKTSSARFPSECLYSADLDCALAFDNFIIIGGHSSSPRNSEGTRVDLAMEPLRYFLEGKKMGESSQHWDVEERDERRGRLENQDERPKLIYNGDAITQPAVAFVRIQEANRDEVYRDWSKAVEAALRVDPSLATKINLEKPLVIAATCGWRLPGDKLSSNNQNWFTSSVYLVLIGEPAGS